MYSNFDLRKKLGWVSIILLSSDPKGNFRFALLSVNPFWVVFYFTKPCIISHILNQISFSEYL